MEKYLTNVQAFNRKHGKRHDAKSTKLTNAYEVAIATHGEDVITNYLMMTTFTNIFDALDEWNIAQWKQGLEQKGQPAVEQKETPQGLVEKNVTIVKSQDVTFGLIEQALAQVIADKYVPVISNQIMDKVTEQVEKTYGRLEKPITYSFAGNKLEEVTHEQFETIFQFVLANEPVMLVGPAGSGKNHIVKQISKLAKLPFYFTNAITQEFKLTGFIDAMGKYHETEFYKAFKNGGIFMLDEIDASIPEVLIILNAAISNRYFDFPNGRIDAHPDFRIIAAGNTFGHGASFQYVGRNQLDGASLNRFAVIEIGYSKAIENSITNDVELIDFIRDFRKAIDQAGMNHIVSYRELIRCNKMLQSSLKPEVVFQICLIKNLENEDIRALKNNMNASNKYYAYLKGHK